jgi:hypothetical protein
MEKLNEIKKQIVKNSMLLTAKTDQAGIAGWTIKHLANESKLPLIVVYYVVKHLMALNYVVQLSNKRFVYAKKFKFDQIDAISKIIVKHWDTCVYSTHEKHLAIPRPIDHFTNRELINEMRKRNLIDDNNRFNG